MCADLLQTAKYVAQCPKNLSQLRWLALRPLVQTNRQTTSLALKGETKRSRLCVVVPVISIMTSHLHSCHTAYIIKSSTSSLCILLFFSHQARHFFVFVLQYFTHIDDDLAPDMHIKAGKYCSHEYNLDSLRLTWHFTEPIG